LPTARNRRPLIHPHQEDEEADEGHPADLGAAAQRRIDVAELDRRAGLAAAADVVERDGGERADEREAGGKRISEIAHAEVSGAEDDQVAARGVEGANCEPVKRHRLEVAQSLAQRLDDVGRADAQHHRILFARNGRHGCLPTEILAYPGGRLKRAR
jgi:hypothetical protein